MLLYALFGAQRAQSYTVHEMPHPPVDRVDRAEALRFIKDGFEFSAFVFAPLWLLAQKLWLGVLGYLVAAAAIVLANEYAFLPDSAALVLMIGLHLIVGLEGDALARLDLERRGWTTLGSVNGLSRLECERRFLETWLPAQPIFAPRHAATKAASSTAPPDVPPTPVSSDRSVAGRFAALLRRPTRNT